MPTEEEIEAACKEVLDGLDEDTLEYLSGGISDILEEGKDELIDYVAPMLEELCSGDDDAARAKAEALWDKLTGGGSGGGGDDASATAQPTVVKRAPISLGGGTSRLEDQTMKEAEAMRSKFAAAEIKFDNAASGGGGGGDGSSAAAAKEAARHAAKQAWLAEQAGGVRRRRRGRPLTSSHSRPLAHSFAYSPWTTREAPDTWYITRAAPYTATHRS